LRSPDAKSRRGNAEVCLRCDAGDANGPFKILFGPCRTCASIIVLGSETNKETVIFSWIVYKSRADRDAIMEKVMADPRLKGDMPFDGKRMIFGGFEMIVQR
jgi:hypothetical protein